MKTTPARAAPAALVLSHTMAAFLGGCGTDLEIVLGPPPGDAAPLAATYDVEAVYPDLPFPEFPATGLRLDMTLEIDPGSIGDPSGALTGTITIQEADAGGIPRAFSPAGPIPIAGRLAGDQIDLMPFGPVTVGLTVLFPDLSGLVSPDGRRMDGIAQLGNLPDAGSWLAIKQRRYLIAATDFGLQGTVSVVTVRYDTRFRLDADLELTSGDPVAAVSRGRPLVVNRLFFDNVQILDPAGAFLTALQFSTANGSNPHDAILPDPNRIYVTRYEPPFDDVLIADASTGAALGRIDLAPYGTNATGTPRPDRMIEANGMILVTLQNIDAAFADYGPGRVAFIDPATDGVVEVVTLAGQNPIGPLAVHPASGRVLVADAGIFQGTVSRALTGGIEVIDPISMTTEGLLVDDDDLGGNVSGVAVASASRAYAVVVTSAGSNSLVAFDPTTGAVGGTVLTTSAFIPEIRYDGDGYLLVAEHDLGVPRLRVLDAATGAEVARITLSLPPFSIAILTRDLTGGS